MNKLTDIGFGGDSIKTLNIKPLHEGFTLHGLWAVPKWDWNGDVELQAYAEKLMQGGLKFKEAYKMFTRFCTQDDAIVGENLMLNAGINLMINLLAGAGGTVFSNANGRIGVGDSTTAAVASQTGLQAATNKVYTAYDATYPTTGANQQFISRCTVTGSNANFHWQEFTNDNGTTSLNRFVSDQGTKVLGQTWQPTVTITES